MMMPVSSVVMRGLDPRIHPIRKNFFKRWIAGSSPAMTACDVSAKA